MRVAGIIAEYDPFHAGHAWQIGQLRQQGFDRIVICMSSWADSLRFRRLLMSRWT